MLFKRLVFCRIFATFYEKEIYVSKYTEVTVLLMYTNDIYDLDVIWFSTTQRQWLTAKQVQRISPADEVVGLMRLVV
jgi:hypothetical protein